MEKEELKKLFNKPKVIGIVGNVDTGKSNMIYYIIEELKRQKFNFNLYSYGLRFDLGEQKIYSIEELEQIKNSIIILDEFFTLFDLEDRKKRSLIEKSIRLISHNNNILILCGHSENFKKFISSKLEIIIFKKVILGDLINGSRVKNVCLNYKGEELGSNILNIPLNECLIFDGNYSKIQIPYLNRFDSKKNNCPIICENNVPDSVLKKVVKR